MVKKHAPVRRMWRDLYGDFTLKWSACIMHNTIKAVAVDHMVNRIVAYTLGL